MFFLLANSFSELYLSNKYSTSNPQKGDTTIRAHRVVLGALSPILLNIFSKKEHSMSAESVQPDTLAALVEFVYNSEAQLSPESLIKLRDATSTLGQWLERK